MAFKLKPISSLTKVVKKLSNNNGGPGPADLITVQGGPMRKPRERLKPFGRNLPKKYKGGPENK